jgi:hypothetical protein
MLKTRHGELGLKTIIYYSMRQSIVAWKLAKVKRRKDLRKKYVRRDPTYALLFVDNVMSMDLK